MENTEARIEIIKRIIEMLKNTKDMRTIRLIHNILQKTNISI